MRKWIWSSSVVLTVAALNLGGCPQPVTNNPPDDSTPGDNSGGNNGGNNGGSGGSGTGVQNGGSGGSGDSGGNGGGGSGGDGDSSGDGGGGGGSGGGSADGGSGGSGSGGGAGGGGGAGSGDGGGGGSGDGGVPTPPADSQLPGAYSGQTLVLKAERTGINDSVSNSTQPATLDIEFDSDGTLSKLLIPGFRKNSHFVATLAAVGDEDTLIERNAAGQITYRLRAILTEITYTATTARVKAELNVVENIYNSSGSRTTRFFGTGIHVSEFSIESGQLKVVSSTDYDTVLRADTVTFETQVLEENKVDALIGITGD